MKNKIRTRKILYLGLVIALVSSMIPLSGQVNGSVPLEGPYIMVQSLWFVAEGDTFPVLVLYDAGHESNPLPNALVTYQILEQENGTSYYMTNEHGIAWITAPKIKQDRGVYITGSKNGYIPQTTEQLLFDSEGKNQLHLKAPISAKEGKAFEVRVTDDHGLPVTGAQVDLFILGGDQLGNTQSYYPDDTGMVLIDAPLMDENTICAISVVQEPLSDYVPDVKQILIINGHGNLQLVVRAQASVFEGAMFDAHIRVNSIYGFPVENAIVMFNGVAARTDKNGDVWFKAPMVEYNKYFLIKATKLGYEDGTTGIIVRNIE